MDFMYIVLIWVILCYQSYEFKMCSYFSKRTATNEITDNVITEITSDIIDCVIGCTQHALCTAITFSKVSMACKFHSQLINANNGNITLPSIWSAMRQKESVCTEKGRKCAEAKFNYVNSLSLCYKIVSEVELYDVALYNCQTEGGGLLRVDSEEKENYMEYAISKIESPATKYYIDARRNGSVWQFINGEEILNFYWYPGANYENKDCIGIHSIKHGWKDMYCTGLHGYICEIK